VAALPWNQWQDSPGIGGSFAVEYAHEAEQAAAEDAERQAIRDQEQMEKHAWEALETQIAALHTLITSEVLQSVS